MGKNILLNKMQKKIKCILLFTVNSKQNLTQNIEQH